MPLFGPPNIEKLRVKRDIPALTNAVAYKNDATVRKAAVVALQEIGGVQVIEPLNAALTDVDSQVSLAAVNALGHLGAIAVEPLITALETGSPEIKVEAAQQLGEIGDLRAVEPLIELLKDHIRVPVIEALGKLSDIRAVEPLVKILENDEAYERDRRAALFAVGKVGDQRVCKPLVWLLWSEKSGPVRRDIVSVLDKLGWQPTDNLMNAFPPDAIPYKEESMWGDILIEAAVIYWIVKGRSDECSKMGSSAIQKLGELIYDHDLDVSREAVIALGKIGGPEVISPLVHALKFPDLHYAVSKYLNIMTDDLHLVVPLLHVVVASHRDSRPYKVAMNALKRFGMKAVPLLIEQLQYWENNGGPESYMQSLGVRSVLTELTSASLSTSTEWRRWFENQERKE